MATIIQPAAFNQAAKTTANKEKKDKNYRYQLHIELSFSEPLIWRRVQVAGRHSLADLHGIIQVLFGWDGSAAHQFMVGKILYKTFLEETAPGSDARRFDESHTTLDDLQGSMKYIFLYVYSLSNGWECTIEAEEIQEENTKMVLPPELIGGSGRLPDIELADVHEYNAWLRERKGQEQLSVELSVNELEVINAVLRRRFSS